MNTTITELSAIELTQMIRAGKLSVQECCQAFIEKNKSLDPKLRVWTYFDPAQILKAAVEMDQDIAKNWDKWDKKSLLGVPVAVKDIFNTTHMPTCMGSPLWEGFTPGNDARVVHYFRYAGAILFGKSVTAEFAVHNPGPTRNPHDPKRTPGTSSSGSAVAVAAGMTPLALGTQTAGSIIRPASYCGIYGFKPSFGVVPRTGVLKTTDTLDTVGLFARTIGDIELGFAEMHVKGHNYPLFNRVLTDSRSKGPHKRKWKIGWVKTHTWDQAQSYARQAFESWVKKLAQNAPEQDVSEFQMPSEFERSHEIHATIYDKCLSYYFRKEFESKELISKTMNEMILKGRGISPEQYQEALQSQAKLSERLDGIFSDFDILISLSVAGEAPLETDPEPRDPSLMWTLCGVPAFHVPLFKGPHGLPFGVQVISRRYYDHKLMNWLKTL